MSSKHYFYFKFDRGEDQVLEFVLKLPVADKEETNSTRIVERMELIDVFSFFRYATVCSDLTAQMRIKNKEDGFLRPMSTVEIDECLQHPELTVNQAATAVRELYIGFSRREVIQKTPYDEAMKVLDD